MSPETPLPPTGKPYKRRTLVINKTFQYKFITIVMTFVAVGILIIAVDMFTSLGHYVAENSQSVDLTGVYHDAWQALLVKVLFYLGGVYVVALVVSNRIAGPLYRFEKSAEEVALGNLAHRAFIRKGDDWSGFRESFNGMTEALHKKVSEDVAHAKAAGKLLEDLAADASLPDAAREKARKALAETSSIGARFKLS